ncbi:synaptonemal complex protein, partial [Fagus crenata]
KSTIFQFSVVINISLFPLSQSRNCTSRHYNCTSRHFAENSRSSESKMQALLPKISALESENKDNLEKFQSKIQRKAEEIDILQKDSEKHTQHGQETKLEDQVKENQGLLTAAESKLAEAKNQYDQMLESKQLELSRHLKEISQRNDQAINDIRRKYEMEKLEIVNMEKEKAGKVVGEMERKCDQKLTEIKEESQQYLMRVQEEHAALVCIRNFLEGGCVPKFLIIDDGWQEIVNEFCKEGVAFIEGI